METGDRYRLCVFIVLVVFLNVTTGFIGICPGSKQNVSVQGQVGETVRIRFCVRSNPALHNYFYVTTPYTIKCNHNCSLPRSTITTTRKVIKNYYVYNILVVRYISPQDFPINFQLFLYTGPGEIIQIGDTFTLTYHIQNTNYLTQSSFQMSASQDQSTFLQLMDDNKFLRSFTKLKEDIHSVKSLLGIILRLILKPDEEQENDLSMSTSLTLGTPAKLSAAFTSTVTNTDTTIIPNSTTVNHNLDYFTIKMSNYSSNVYYISKSENLTVSDDLVNYGTAERICQEVNGFLLTPEMHVSTYISVIRKNSDRKHEAIWLQNCSNSVGKVKVNCIFDVAKNKEMYTKPGDRHLAACLITMNSDGAKQFYWTTETTEWSDSHFDGTMEKTLLAVGLGVCLFGVLPILISIILCWRKNVQRKSTRKYGIPHRKLMPSDIMTVFDPAYKGHVTENLTSNTDSGYTSITDQEIYFLKDSVPNDYETIKDLLDDTSSCTDANNSPPSYMIVLHPEYRDWVTAKITPASDVDYSSVINLPIDPLSYIDERFMSLKDVPED